MPVTDTAQASEGKKRNEDAFQATDALCALMVVLAIDAEKCSRNNHT